VGQGRKHPKLAKLRGPRKAPHSPDARPASMEAAAGAVVCSQRGMVLLPLA